MIDTEKYKKYKGCSVEDLLQDDFLISSINNPTKETDAFWQEVVDKGMIDSHDFELASYFVKSVQVQPEIISKDDIYSLWEDIEVKNKINLRNKRKRFNIYFSTVAGIAALLAIAFILFNQLPDVEPELQVYNIEEVKAPDAPVTDIQLIFSDNEAVSLEGEEADITYNEAGIAINNKEAKYKNESKDAGRQVVYNQLIVPNGKRSMLTFAEGSRIWVNAGTRVVYPVVFEKNKREIYVDGEAFLEVSRNEDCPFIVKTKELDVEVLGTSFNIMAYEKDTIQNIVLVDGSVKVKADRVKEVVLVPNEMYSLANGAPAIRTVDVDDYISWKKGLYQYKSEQLGVLLQRLSRYYGEEITCSPKASLLKCSGKLDLKDELSKVLNAISQTAPVSWEYKDDKYLITNK